MPQTKVKINIPPAIPAIAIPHIISSFSLCIIYLNQLIINKSHYYTFYTLNKKHNDSSFLYLNKKLLCKSFSKELHSNFYN